MDNTTTVSVTSPTATPQDAARTSDTGLKHEAPKRKKTWGEKLFNWGTYGGVAMLGNEVASLAITESIKEDQLLHSGYKKFEGVFSMHGKSTNDLRKKLPEYIVGSTDPKKFVKGKPLEPRLPFLLFATIGGMFMVPFVKYLEDHKGAIVHKLDHNHYGDLSDSDPKLIEAHKEMDDAPKQTWGSLGVGRLTTVAAAAVADATFGWDHALTTKLFRSPHVSLNGLSRIVANSLARVFKPEAVKSLQTPEARQVIDAFKKSELPTTPSGQKIIETFKKVESFKAVPENATWLLTLSSTLTVLFYATSKLFAKKQEEKKEEKQEQRFMRANGTYSDVAEDNAPMVQTEPLMNEKPAEKPSLQVKNVSHEHTLATMPQLSQGV